MKGAKLATLSETTLAAARREDTAKALEAATSAIEVLRGLEGPPQAWIVAGTLFMVRGKALLAARDADRARDDLEMALECTRVDVREVFPALVQACVESADEASALEVLRELLLAGGSLDVPWAVPLLERMPGPPAPHQTWETVRPLDEWSLAEKLDRDEYDLRDATWQQGNSSLHVAAGRGDGYTVRRALQRGVDVNAVRRGGSGVTALNLAVARDRLDVAELLVAAGASVRGDFRSPLLNARSASAVRWLVHLGADIETTDAQGRSPLRVAVDRADLELARAFLGVGADRAHADLEGRTPLDVARASKLAAFRQIAELLDAGQA